MLKRCKDCYGSGKVMGGGMLLQDCEVCDGRGKIQVIEKDIEYLEEKTTVSYNEAIDKIKAETNLNDKDAKEIFDKEIKRMKRQKSNDAA